jgi:hypothetical protein
LEEKTTLPVVWPAAFSGEKLQYELVRLTVGVAVGSAATAREGTNRESDRTVDRRKSFFIVI